MDDFDKKVVQIEVDRKNTAAVIQALDELRSTCQTQQERIDGLISTVSTLHQRMLELEQLVRVQKAMTFGSGPSVRT
jgi:hypothetical protein